MGGTVWMSEDDDYRSVETYYLGTFSGHLDEGEGEGEEFHGLPLEEALAWGRARSERVYLRYEESGYFSAGSDNSAGFPEWPPEELPHWERRRPASELWKDRTEDDSPIRWVVTISLGPPVDELPREHDAWDAAAAATARHAGAPGVKSFGVDEMFEAQRRADEHFRRTGEHVGWTGYVPVYTFDLAATASTRDAAAADTIARCGPLLEGWNASAEARPAESGPGQTV